MQVTGALGVAVVIEAKHMCMMMRGVEKQNSSMITSVMLGEFRENAATAANPQPDVLCPGGADWNRRGRPGQSLALRFTPTR